MLVTLVCAACTAGSAQAPSPATTVRDDAPTPGLSFEWVVANDLALDSGPAEIEETAAVTPAVLAAGEQVWVLETRQTTSGAWHLVVADQMVPDFEIPFGWVTAERDGAPVLGAAPLACPDPPLSVDQAAELGRFGGLACYGNVPIEVRGFTPIGCGAGGSPRTGTPDWLNGTWSGIGIGDREPSPPDFDVGAAIGARVQPGHSPEAGCGQPGWFRFVGRYDHPASSTCRTQDTNGLVEVVIDARVTELLCRTQLVLTDVLPLQDPG